MVDLVTVSAATTAPAMNGGVAGFDFGALLQGGDAAASPFAALMALLQNKGQAGDPTQTAVTANSVAPTDQNTAPLQPTQWSLLSQILQSMAEQNGQAVPATLASQQNSSATQQSAANTPALPSAAGPAMLLDELANAAATGASTATTPQPAVKNNTANGSAANLTKGNPESQDAAAQAAKAASDSRAAILMAMLSAQTEITTKTASETTGKAEDANPEDTAAKATNANPAIDPSLWNMLAALLQPQTQQPAKVADTKDVPAAPASVTDQSSSPDQQPNVDQQAGAAPAPQQPAVDPQLMAALAATSQPTANATMPPSGAADTQVAPVGTAPAAAADSPAPQHPGSDTSSAGQPQQDAAAAASAAAQQVPMAPAAVNTPAQPQADTKQTDGTAQPSQSAAAAATANPKALGAKTNTAKADETKNDETKAAKTATADDIKPVEPKQADKTAADKPSQTNSAMDGGIQGNPTTDNTGLAATAQDTTSSVKAAVVQDMPRTSSDPSNTNATQTAVASTVQSPAPLAAEPRKLTAELQVSTQPQHDVSSTIDKLGITIATRTADGSHHFDIRLDPPELGRVQVHLTVDDAGRAQANLVVDKPQTLQLLQQDSSALHRTLNDAGLNLSNNGLNFSLREQNQQNDGRTDKGRGRSLSVKAVVQTDARHTSSSIGSYAPDSVRLDIRV